MKCHKTEHVFFTQKLLLNLLYKHRAKQHIMSQCRCPSATEHQDSISRPACREASRPPAPTTTGSSTHYNSSETVNQRFLLRTPVSRSLAISNFFHTFCGQIIASLPPINTNRIMVRARLHFMPGLVNFRDYFARHLVCY